MSGYLGSDFNQASPAEVDQGLGGASSLRDIKARIITFFSLLWNLSTGVLNAQSIPITAFQDQPVAVAGTWNKITTDASGFVTKGENNTKASDYSGLNGALTKDSLVDVAHGGTGLTGGPSGPKRIYIGKSTRLPDYFALADSSSILWTFSDVLQTVAGNAKLSTSRSFFRSKVQVFPFNFTSPGVYTLALPDINPSNGLAAWKMFSDSDAGPVAGIPPKFIIYDYWVKLNCSAGGITSSLTQPLGFSIVADTTQFFQTAAPVFTGSQTYGVGAYRAGDILQNVATDDSFGTPNVGVGGTGPFCSQAVGQDPYLRYGAWALPFVDPTGSTKYANFRAYFTLVSGALPTVGVVGATLEVGCRYTVS